MGGIMFSIFNTGNKNPMRTNTRKRRVLVDECFDKIVTELFVKFLPSSKRVVS